MSQQHHRQAPQPPAAETPEPRGVDAEPSVDANPDRVSDHGSSAGSNYEYPDVPVIVGPEDPEDPEPPSYPPPPPPPEEEEEFYNG